jgi:hypothetical protein
MENQLQKVQAFMDAQILALNLNMVVALMEKLLPVEVIKKVAHVNIPDTDVVQMVKQLPLDQMKMDVMIVDMQNMDVVQMVNLKLSDQNIKDALQQLLPPSFLVELLLHQKLLHAVNHKIKEMSAMLDINLFGSMMLQKADAHNFGMADVVEMKIVLQQKKCVKLSVLNHQIPDDAIYQKLKAHKDVINLLLDIGMIILQNNVLHSGGEVVKEMQITLIHGNLVKLSVAMLDQLIFNLQQLQPLLQDNYHMYINQQMRQNMLLKMVEFNLFINQINNNMNLFKYMLNNNSIHNNPNNHNNINPNKLIFNLNNLQLHNILIHVSNKLKLLNNLIPVLNKFNNNQILDNKHPLVYNVCFELPFLEKKKH